MITHISTVVSPLLLVLQTVGIRFLRSSTSIMWNLIVLDGKLPFPHCLKESTLYGTELIQLLFPSAPSWPAQAAGGATICRMLVHVTIKYEYVYNTVWKDGNKQLFSKIVQLLPGKLLTSQFDSRFTSKKLLSTMLVRDHWFTVNWAEIYMAVHHIDLPKS